MLTEDTMQTTVERRPPVALALERLHDQIAKAEGMVSGLAKRIDSVVCPGPESPERSVPGPRPAGSDLTNRIHGMADELGSVLQRLERLYDGIEL